MNGLPSFFYGFSLPILENRNRFRLSRAGRIRVPWVADLLKFILQFKDYIPAFSRSRDDVTSTKRKAEPAK